MSVENRCECCGRILQGDEGHHPGCLEGSEQVPLALYPGAVTDLNTGREHGEQGWPMLPLCSEHYKLGYELGAAGTTV